MYRPREWLYERILRGCRADLTVSARALAPREGRPLELIEDSGTGKSRLLIGAGTAIAEAGRSVRCTTTSALVNELAEADAAKRLSSVTTRCSKVDLLCLGEFGYLTWTSRAPNYRSRSSLSARNARPPAVASNTPFSEGDKTFTDLKFCAATVDRLACIGTLIQTGTDAHRLKATETEHHTTRRP